MTRNVWVQQPWRGLSVRQARQGPGCVGHIVRRTKPFQVWSTDGETLWSVHASKEEAVNAIARLLAEWDRRVELGQRREAGGVIA